MKLQTQKYSPSFVEGIMLGTGRIAGTVMSEEGKDIIGLNHECLYGGLYKDRESRDVPREVLEKIRHMIRYGDRAEATMFTCDAFSGSGMGWWPHHIDPFKPGGMLHLTMDNAADGYSRELDLDRGVTKITRGGTTYTYFADIISDRIFVFIDGKVSIEAQFSFKPDEKLRYKRVIEIAEDGKSAKLAADGEYSIGVFFQTRADVYTDGRIYAGCAVADVQEAESNDVPQMGPKDSVRSKQGVATIEVNEHAVLVFDLEVGDDPKKINALMDARKVLPKPMDEQMQFHIQRWHEIYNKAFRIKDNAVSHTPDDKVGELAGRCRENGVDPQILRAFTALDVYMCISAGINAHELLNLQGKWNIDPDPAWNCDHHYDCNVEACYWPYEKAGLSECGMSIFDYCEDVVPAAKVTAQRLFKCEGAFFSFTDDIWKRSTQEAHMWDVWVCAGPWLASHFWKHYEYTEDKDFLENRAYPFFKEICRFFEDFLYEDENGVLQISPTQSPENRYKEGMCETSNITTTVCESPAIDISLVNELMTSAIQSAKILGVDEDKIQQWTSILERLQPLQIDPRNGRLMEWDKPFEEGWPDHFHYSPLYGVYPGGAINAIDEPEYFEASKKLFDHRIASGSAKHIWPLGCHWASSLYSAFGDPQGALDCIDYIARKTTEESLLSCLDNWLYGKVFQFENCSTRLNAIIDLFAVSLAGRVQLCKKLPEKLAGIGYENLYLKGGFVAEAEYDETGAIKECRIVSTRGNVLTLVGEWCVDGCAVSVEQGCTVLNTEAGKEYVIRPV